MTELGRDHVSAVEPSPIPVSIMAMSTFLWKNIRMPWPRSVQKGGFDIPTGLFHFFGESHHKIPLHHCSVDADSFPEIMYMGRGVEPCFIASLLKDGGKHVTRTTFTVSAGNVYRFE